MASWASGFNVFVVAVEAESLVFPFFGSVDASLVVLSSWATSNLEQVGSVAPDSLKIFQIYMSKDSEVNADLWKRVKDQGFSAMALTTDTQLLGKREGDVRSSFALPEHLKLANWTKYTEKSVAKDFSTENS